MTIILILWVLFILGMSRKIYCSIKDKPFLPAILRRRVPDYEFIERVDREIFGDSLSTNPELPNYTWKVHVDYADDIAIRLYDERNEIVGDGWVFGSSLIGLSESAIDRAVSGKMEAIAKKAIAQNRTKAAVSSVVNKYNKKNLEIT